jgi:hypothetical protein
MFQRLPHYLLIVVTAVYVMWKWQIVSKSAHLDKGLTERDYFELAKVIVLLIAASSSVFTLLRDKRSPSVEQGTAAAIAGHFRQVFARLAEASTRRPILMTILTLSFLAIPVGLRALGTEQGWKGFGIFDWILVGLAEIPFAGAAAYVIWMSWKSKNG